MRRILIIVPCSDRKFGVTVRNLQAASVPKGSIDEVSDSWLNRINDTAPTDYAGSLYAGRSFKELRNACRLIDAELVVVSAGLGIVHQSKKVPNYALTVTNGSKDSIGERISDGVFSSDLWWETLKRKRKNDYDLHRYLCDMNADLILLGLSKPYAKMIYKDLANLPVEIIQKSRVFGIGIKSELPEPIASNLLDYDQRMNGPDSNLVGTMTDLVARCIHDFCQVLKENSNLGVDVEMDQAFVNNRLQGWRYPIIPKRKNLTDPEIIKFILANWENTQGVTNKSLRLLRSQGYACEQGRFGKIIASVRNERIEQRNLGL